jgi:hypothetical protein
MRLRLLLGLALVLATAGGAFAQGTQTGVLTGTVLSSDQLPLPGVTVSIRSDALLGTRTAVTDVNGGYIFKAVPPGEYEVSYTLSGFATVQKKVTVALGSSVPVDATMTVAAIQENVTVTAEEATPLTTTQVGANYKQDMIDSLPVGRTVAAVASFAPGLTTNTPNAAQVSIAGNFAYDNVFLIDGVDVNDNLFGSANTVFIEDAIAETQILTSGISAEYGRFGGGVINTITKSGGNTLSGSLRLNFTNPAWRDETPIEKKQGVTRQSDLSKYWEATLGGPIVKDRLWFFAAGRKENSNLQSTLTESGLPFNQTRDQKRGEIKLSGAITPNHTLTATYTDVGESIYRLPFGATFDIDPVHDAYNAKQPNSLLAVNYNGTLRSNLFVEAQYSQKKFEFQNSGGTSTSIIDSPYIAQSVAAAYNAPYFDASDPESRNNRQVAASLSYFLSTRSLGKHDIKVGYENYASKRTGGNSQSSTGYVFYTDYVTDADGKPVFDANNYVVPDFVPGVSQLQNWQAVKGAEITLTTQSAYVNDKWTLDNHWSFNLGARAEWASGQATAGIKPVSASRIVPRLGASFDVRGDGRFRLDATYSHYAGKYSETQFANNTNVGNPNAIYYLYTGPAGQGRDFAPGIDPRNYTQIIGGAFPTANIKYDPNIKSPVTKEYTGAFGMELGRSGYVKAIYTYRKITDFVQQFIDQATGTTEVVVNGFDFGSFSNHLWANDNTGLRTYSALQFQAAYRPTSAWDVEGHYTYMFKDDGNQEGEATNQPGVPSVFSGYYPELFDEARSYPVGHLLGYQKHRLRLWTTYDLRLGKAGDANLGLLYTFDSGTAYSIRSAGVPLTPVQKAIGAQYYPDLPTTQTVFYAQGRGSEFFEPQHLFNVALTYGVPVWKTARPWVKFEVRNLFDSTPLISYNTTTRPDPNSPTDALGIPTGYVKGGLFGQGTSTANYPFPREYFLSVGFRF